jgi:hypothetical protein
VVDGIPEGSIPLDSILPVSTPVDSTLLDSIGLALQALCGDGTYLARPQLSLLGQGPHMPKKSFIQQSERYDKFEVVIVKSWAH